MIVGEADARMLPSYRTYEIGERFFRPLVEQLGGYAVHGAESLRSLDGQNYILAPNHRANWDSIILGLAMLDLPALTQEAEEGPLQPRAIHYMAKHTLWRWPIVKQFVESCGAFPVERNRGVGLEDHQINHTTKLMDGGSVMVIYPQGHRERGQEDEESLDPDKFKTTIGFLALKYGIPIVPVGIAGPAKGPKLPRTLVFGEPIFVAKSLAASEEALKADKRDLMAYLHGQVNQTYQQARQLHSEQYPETSWLRDLGRLSNSPLGRTALAWGLTAGLTLRAGSDFMRTQGRNQF